MKTVIVLMLALMAPTLASAQQLTNPAPAQSAAASGPEVIYRSGSGDESQRIGPQFRILPWRSLGNEALIQDSAFPVADRDELRIQNVIGGAKGYEVFHEVTKTAFYQVFFPGVQNPEKDPQIQAFWNDFVTETLAGDFELLDHYGKGMVTYCAMAFGLELSNGRLTSRTPGRMEVLFDTPLRVYQWKARTMTYGPYAGATIAPIIPQGCFNLSCVQAVPLQEEVSVVAPMPEVKTAEIEVVKEVIDVNKRRIDTPSRQEAQLAITATPNEGGPVRKEVFNNRSEKFTFPVGTEVLFTEEGFDPEFWRPLQPDGIKVTVRERNERVIFTNMKIEQVVSQIPLQPVERRVEVERKGGHKWLWTAIAVGAGATAVAMFLPRGGETEIINVPVPGVKGTTTNGGPAR